MEKIHELTITKFRHNYDITTSNLNIAIKTCKQPKQSITAEDSRIYWKGFISNIPNQKSGKTKKQSRTVKTQQIIISQAFKIIIRDKL